VTIHEPPVLFTVAAYTEIGLACIQEAALEFNLHVVS
jgi:hypothetical protein